MKLRVIEPFFLMDFFLAVFFFGGDIRILFKNGKLLLPILLQYFFIKKGKEVSVLENMGGSNCSYFSRLST